MGRGFTVRFTAVACLLVVAFFVRLAFEEPGPMFLFPTLLAGLWFGRWSGAAVGAIGAALFAVAAAINGGREETELLWVFLARLGLYCATGYVTGSLSEQRYSLATTVDRRERQLAELRAIQEALRPPEPPHRPGLDIAVRYLPAAEGAAGDFYVVAEGPTQDVTIVAIGDVAGKGIEAARRATFVRTTLVTSAPFVDDPGQLLELANQALIERAGISSSFVTAACVVYRAGDSSIKWSQAGHPPPLMFGERTYNIDCESAAPLGIGSDLHCSVCRGRLELDSGLLLYTDGLTEARRTGARLDLLGEERVSRKLAELRTESSTVIVDEILTAARRFCDDALADDICIVAARAASRGS